MNSVQGVPVKDTKGRIFI